MADIYKLRNQIKFYEWGSPDLIPRFLGAENPEGKPWAEMWMGTHFGAPSMVVANGSETPLKNLVSVSPQFSPQGELPFLFKLLAAGKPLSIQAHPNIAQAREGFERESRAGYFWDDSKRNYKDPNHKPEIACALTPFTVMCGFRQPEEIRSLLEALLASAAPKAAIEPLIAVMQTARQGAGQLATYPLFDFFCTLFNMPKSSCNELCAFLREAEPCSEVSGPCNEVSGLQWKLMRDFAAQYPGDPAVLSPLYLNLFTLEPGQAIFLPAGILHSYISGMALELMTSSDNVIRGGLTPKHIDIPELFNIMDFSPYMPQIYSPPSGSSWFRYPAPCKDFSLFLMRSGGEKKDFPENRPAICIVTEGELYITGRHFKKGESFFIPKSGAPLSFEGTYSLFAAIQGAGTP